MEEKCDMKEIMLTQGKVALVDDEDYERLNQFKWYASFERGRFYAAKGVWNEGKHTTIRMHREIMNNPTGMDIDHINNNGLDNCKENLRICYRQQNMQNQRKAQQRNKLRIKGVHWREDAKKFRAGIKSNGKQIWLGYFNVLGDADSAYRKAEEKYFGEFTRKE